MRILKKALGITNCGDYIEVATDSVPVRIWLVADGIVRIRAGFDGSFRERSYTLAMTAWADEFDQVLGRFRRRVAPVRASGISEDGDGFTIKGPGLTLRIKKDPFAIEIQDPEGRVLHRDQPWLGYREDPNHRRIHSCEIGREDRFYGFGEHTGGLNKNHEYLRESGNDSMGYDPDHADPLYKHIPFYIRMERDSRIATGYFYNTTSECAFDIGKSHSNYWKPQATFIADSGDIDLYFIMGPRIKDVVERYTDLTGKSAMLPACALGYLGSTMYYSELPEHCDDAIVRFIDQCREEGIPIDGFQLSSGYCEIDTPEGQKRCTFNWDGKRFPNPRDFFRRMSERGITVSPNVKPGQLLVSPLYEDMRAHGAFVAEEGSDDPEIGMWWGGKGSFFDYTSSQAREYWKERLKQTVIRKGTYSIWNDNCEFESIVNKDARVSLEGQGGTIGEIKSEMANLMCHITHEAIEEENPSVRPFVVCRSGHSGIQRYAQTWDGDNFTSWESLRGNIPTILNMGLSGVANNGCDIGGFYGPAPEGELLVRWVQHGIFQPRFSIHSTNTDNTVTEPWMYTALAPLVREAIALRYRMFPHLYSLMRRAHVTGLPIMSALPLEFQDDERCDEESVNFMEGDLFVANVVEKGARTREIYFPRGYDYYDFFTYEKYEGGRTYRFEVGLNSIPLFIRSGGIVPLAQNRIMNISTELVTDLEIKVMGDRDGAYTLYEDDGSTRDFERGVFKSTELAFRHGTVSTLSAKVGGTYNSPIERLRLSVCHPQKSPFSVSLNGQRLTQILRPAEFDKAPSGCWSYNHDTKSVEIKLDNPPADYVVEISFEKFDLLGM
ncbi:MAG: DUF4968 domain-containing protein [Succinivibrionaceae bacterium]|nr:DUF4968 domain-containing protein [Succinivibrionaceae bacterium]